MNDKSELRRELIQRAQSLVPILRERAEATENNRAVPAETHAEADPNQTWKTPEDADLARTGR